MAEPTQQAEESPVNDAQDAPMPSADQQPSPQPVQEADVASEQGSTLPEDASERTKREFDKLRNQLRDERARRTYVESVFSGMQQPQAATVPDPTYNADPVSQAFQEAQQARQEAARTREEWQSYLQEQEDREAFAAHPELNPTDSKTFDRDLHVATRRIYLDAMLNPQDYGGKQLTLKAAGDLAKKVQTPAIEQARKAGAQEAFEKLTPKEQAALEAIGNPNGRTEMASSSLADLQQRSRKGDIDALAARLRNIPKVGE